MDLIEANCFYKILSYLPNNSINSVRQSNKSLYNKSKSYVLSNYQFKFNDNMVSRFYYNTYRNIRNIIVESIDCLKYFDNLKSITFEHYFNQPLKDSIPGSVIHLTFGTRFDQPIKDSIPGSVTHLVIGWKFNQPIKDSIPGSVTHLTFGICFNQPIKDSIPEFVTHLIFDHKFKHFNPHHVPTTVTNLIFLN